MPEPASPIVQIIAAVVQKNNKDVPPEVVQMLVPRSIIDKHELTTMIIARYIETQVAKQNKVSDFADLVGQAKQGLLQVAGPPEAPRIIQDPAKWTPGTVIVPEPEADVWTPGH
jgi:hypothetical protein